MKLEYQQKMSGDARRYLWLQVIVVTCFSMVKIGLTGYEVSRFFVEIWMNRFLDINWVVLFFPFFIDEESIIIE